MEDEDEAQKTIHHISRAGSLDALSILLQQDASLVNARGLYLWTPLMAAAHEGHLMVVRMLVENGAQLDVCSHYGSTALYLACLRGHADIAEFLLMCGADATIRRIDGMNALMAAAQYGHLGIVRRLLRHGKVAINAVDSNGQTALWWACENRHYEVARALLMDGGADHTIGNHFGRTPIDVSKFRGYQACVDLIKWYEQEAERPYLIERARSVHDHSVAMSQSPTLPVPVYLQDRVAAGFPLPQVDIGGWGRKRLRRHTFHTGPSGSTHAGTTASGTLGYGSTKGLGTATPEATSPATTARSISSSLSPCSSTTSLSSSSSSNSLASLRREAWGEDLEREPGHGRTVDEEERCSVIEYVVTELNQELYQELLQGLKLSHYGSRPQQGQASGPAGAAKRQAATGGACA